MTGSRNDDHSARPTPEWRASVRQAIIQEVKGGCSKEEAARRSGVHPQTHWRWLQKDSAYKLRMKAACAESIRRIKATVLASMRDGLTLGQSCNIAGRKPGTLLAWREQDAAFDAKLRRLIQKQRKKRPARARRNPAKKDGGRKKKP